jgi:hypothetical protein
MKSCRLLLCLLALALAPNSWSSSDEQSAPSEPVGAGDVALAFSKATLKVDLEAALKLSTKQSAEKIRETLKTEKPSGFVPTLIKVEAGDKKATATLLFPGESRVPILLVKEDGEWKVDFVATVKGIEGESKGEAEPPARRVK